jgi:ectoine hydroxylase-related dioxygenase (phytanoyl-CoA dioxygenase family)
MSQFYGINNRTTNKDEIDSSLENIRVKGFSIVRDVLNRNELDDFRTRLDAVYESQVKRIGIDRLSEINDLNMARCLLAEDPKFLDIALNNKVLSLVSAILGDYFILHLQNGIINRSNEEHHQSSWHRDLPYQNFSISTPLAVGALFCLDPFNKETGGTFVVPYTHQLERLPSDEYIQSNMVQIEANAGDVLLFDSMLLHRAGVNQSGLVRRGLNNVYVKPFLKQQISLPKALGPDFTQDPFLLRLLGYQSEVSTSSDEWRASRFIRKNNS